MKKMLIKQKVVPKISHKIAKVSKPQMSKNKNKSTKLCKKTNNKPINNKNKQFRYNKLNLTPIVNQIKNFPRRN